MERNRNRRSQISGTFTRTSSPWIRWCSIVTLMISIVFLCVSLLGASYHSVPGTTLVPLSLVATLVFATFLNVYSLWRFSNEHRAFDQAFRNTDCEFSSMFRYVLDGILIADDAGNCLDANPAAAAILRLSQGELIGKSISCFFINDDAFARGWCSFLRNKNRRGRARLVGQDGRRLYVDFSATANYLPGRHLLILCDATERTRAELSLRRSEERFQHMADNIQEVFWTMDADTREVTYVNRAYAILTGHTIESLRAKPSSYRELIHPEDRIRVLSRLHEVASSGSIDEEFRFVRADGVVRWVWAKGFPVPSHGITRWFVGTAQDITSRKQAVMQIAEHLDAAELARAEAEALRKSTLALSQNLKMDSVLDTLLQCISDLVPYDVATILLVEDASNLMVAREAPRVEPRRIGLTVAASANVFLERILFEQRSVLLRDVARDTEWRDAQPLDRFRSWLGVPIIAAGNVLGILSLGAYAPATFASEHLRLAKSLAVAAAVAITNARVHERAEIYASELQLNLDQLRDTQLALKHAECKISRRAHT